MVELYWRILMFCMHWNDWSSRNTIIFTVIRLWVCSLINIVSLTGRGRRIFLLSSKPIPALEPYPAFCSKYHGGRWAKLRWMPRLRPIGAIFPLIYIPLWYSHEQLDFFSLLDFSRHSVCRIQEIYKITSVKNRRAVRGSNRTTFRKPVRSITVSVIFRK